MEPYMGQIMLFAGSFAPKGWMLCQGQLLNLSQYSALFSILGTTYGGNGTSTFALPNLQGVVAVGQGRAMSGTQYFPGALGGTEGVTLLTTQIPLHTHNLNVVNTAGSASTPSPAGGLIANVTDARTGEGTNTYASGMTPDSTMSPLAIGASGGNQPHNNMQPYLAMSYCIAIEGIYPTRN